MISLLASCWDSLSDVFNNFRINGANNIGSNFSIFSDEIRLTTRPMVIVTNAPVTVYQR